MPKLNFRQAGIHLGVSFGLVFLGFLISAGCFWGYSTNLKERSKQLADENARLTSQISEITGKSAELENRLADSLERTRRLESRIRQLEEANRRVEDMYRRLKQSVGAIVASLEGLETEFTEFGNELQEIIRFVFTLSERS